MSLVRVGKVPTTAKPEGDEYELSNGNKGQSYRDSDGTLYERVTLADGRVWVYRSESR